MYRYYRIIEITAKKTQDLFSMKKDTPVAVYEKMFSSDMLSERLSGP